MVLSAAFILMYSCKEKEKEKEIRPSELPSQVSTTFNTKYPNATDVKWEQEEENGKTVYEADFKFNGKEMEVEIDTAGNLVKEK
jgi:uncharacterized membrane protein YkoI